MIELKVDASKIARLGNAFAAINHQQVELVMVRAANHTGPIARTAMVRTLVPQTGLKRKTLNKALKQKLAFNGGAYTINIKGDNVRLHFFKPRETRAGLIATPWNKKTLYPGVFMKGGQFGKSAKKGRKGRHGGVGAPVQRAGKARLPLKAAPRSGLYIPDEATKGGSEAVFYSTVTARLPGRLAHEVYRILAISA